MTYALKTADNVVKDLKRLERKDAETFKQLMRKVERILIDPYHSGHPLRGEYKGVWETHIRNNLLMYKIHEEAKMVELVAYIDHDLL